MTGGRKVLAIGLVLMVATLVIVTRAAWSGRLESGYVAFNAGEYAEAKHHLNLIADLGDSKAQQLMSYMCGLGLGQPVDFGEAIYWMRKRADRSEHRESIGEQAYFLGAAAVDGLYGVSKKELGVIWLEIAKFSGVQQASDKLRPDG